MEYTNPRFRNAAKTEITTDEGGVIPVDPENSDYASLIASGVPIGAYVAPVPNYEDQRVSGYPKLGDQFDAIWKQLNQDRLGGKALIQEADDLLNAVLAVKAKYPKPK